MPYSGNVFEFIVNDLETIVQHASTSNELQVGTETSQIVESQYEAPRNADFADRGRHGEYVINVHRYADESEIS